MFFVLPKKFALNDSPYAIKKGFEVLCGSSVVGARIEVLALIPHDSRICQRKACVSAIDHVLKWIVGLTRNGSLREPTGCLGSIETVYTVNVLMHKNMGYPICSHVTSVVFCKKKHLYRFSPLDIFFCIIILVPIALFRFYPFYWQSLKGDYVELLQHLFTCVTGMSQQDAFETYKPKLFRQKEGVSRMRSEQGFEFQTCSMNLVND